MTIPPLPLWLRTILGFLIAPLAPGLLIVAFSILFYVIVTGGFRFLGSMSWSGPIYLVKASAMLGYPAAIVMGVPLYLMLRRRGWTRLTTYLAAGALQGFLLYVFWVPLRARLFYSWRDSPDWTSGNTWILLPAGMICGAMAASCFWLIVRPDRAVQHA